MIKMYYIIGKPYRMSRKKIKLSQYFTSKQDCDTFMAESIQNGLMDPDAYITSRMINGQ